MNNQTTGIRLNSNINRLATLSITAVCFSTTFMLSIESSAKASTFFSSQNISQNLIMGSSSSSQSNCLQLGQSLPGMNQSMTLCSPQSASTGGITIGGITIGSSQTSSSNSQIITSGSQTSSQTSNISSQCLTSSQVLSQGSSITQVATMCAPQAPVTVINNSGITIGQSQSNPVLPNANVQSGVFSFLNVSRGLWIDPPTAPGFRYIMTGDSLFTSILDFPTGVDSDNLFNVSAGNRFIGQFSPGQTVDFIALLGNGVREFTVSGIDPLADPNNPTAFPIQLDFNTETASFEQIALSVEEVQGTRIPEPSSTLGLMVFAAFCVGSKFGLKHRRYGIKSST